MTIKGRFDRFIKNIRPTDKHIEETDRQTDFMIGRLKSRISWQPAADPIRWAVRANETASSHPSLVTERTHASPAC